MPAYCIRTRTSPSPGSGMGASSTAMLSAPWILSVFIDFPSVLLGGGGDLATLDQRQARAARRSGVQGGPRRVPDAVGGDDPDELGDPSDERIALGEGVGEEAAADDRLDVRCEATGPLGGGGEAFLGRLDHGRGD